MEEQKQPTPEQSDEPGYIDPASLVFQGRIVIKDADTGEVLVDKRSE